MSREETCRVIQCQDVEKNIHPVEPSKLVFRPSIYAITLRGNDMLVLETKHGLTFPGGRIELGERHEDALKREVLEETGITVAIGPLCDVVTSFWHHKGVGYHCLGPFYRCSYVSGELSDERMSDGERDWQCQPQWLDLDVVMKRGFALTADWRKAMDVALKHPH